MRGRWAPRGRGARAPGEGSKLVVRHLQELRIHVPDTLSLGVEQELVVAAVRTDRWAEETASLSVKSKQPALSRPRDLCVVGARSAENPPFWGEELHPLS